MAHKLANGDYRHKDALIRCTRVPCSTGFSSEWEVRTIKELRGQKFDTLKQACAAIESALTQN